ncbi:MAG TPA: UDP-N-acetylmuramate dehydrogenase [Deltaproteobacteria bacterium]|nr:UDP-N-acetylmuramate dehydrogenase [Deltaproteobacteria bacterium]
MTAARNRIEAILGKGFVEQVLYDEPVSRHASLGVGGKADAMIVIKNETQLADIVKKLKEAEVNYLPVGNLTNVIVRDGGYKGAILLMKELNEVKYYQSQEGAHYIFAQAGASLSSIVSVAVEEELAGMECFAGIPGSVGGALRMNAGAYGKEIKDVISKIHMIDNQGDKQELNKEEISFGYRKADFPPGAIIVGADFLLGKGTKSEIKKQIYEIMEWRRNNHPLEYPSAGSIFKNIFGRPAGKIIEELGLKGTSRGGAKISTKHANFIINEGNATASDVLELIGLIQSRAKKEKGIVLETEVIVVGEP